MKISTTKQECKDLHRCFSDIGKRQTYGTHPISFQKFHKPAIERKASHDAIKNHVGRSK